MMRKKNSSTSASLRLMMLNWDQARALAKPIRTAVFIEEQDVDDSEEWDDEDLTALHIIVIKNNLPIATARLLPQGKIGRMSVLKAHRRQGIGSMMLNELIKAAKQQHLATVELWSQTHAQDFYQKHGFHAYGEVFQDAGIPHIAMRKQLA